MKIWIIAADPFLREFEKISQNWPPETEVYITTLTKYGVNLRSFINFSWQYLIIRPDVILSDHGYLAFAIIRFLSKIFRIKTKTIFYLRGNWWLEERARYGKAT